MAGAFFLFQYSIFISRIIDLTFVFSDFEQNFAQVFFFLIVSTNFGSKMKDLNHQDLFRSCHPKVFPINTISLYDGSR